MVDFHSTIVSAEKIAEKYSDLYGAPSEVLLQKIMYDENINLDFFPVRVTKFSGLLMIDEDIKTIMVNSNHITARQNFSVGHELGHYFYHYLPKQSNDSNEVCFYSMVASAVEEINDEDIKDEEREANLFAAHLLLPTFYLDNVIHKKSFKELKCSSNVSSEFLRWRLTNYLKNQGYGKNSRRLVLEYENNKILVP